MLLLPAPYLSGRGEVNSIHFIRDRWEQLLKTKGRAHAAIRHRPWRTSDGVRSFRRVSRVHRGELRPAGHIG